MQLLLMCICPQETRVPSCKASYILHFSMMVAFCDLSTMLLRFHFKIVFIYSVCYLIVCCIFLVFIMSWVQTFPVTVFLLVLH